MISNFYGKPGSGKRNIRKKFQDEKLPLVDEVIELDAESRKTQKEADDLRANRNKISKEIGALMAQGKKDEAMAKKEEVAAGAKRLAELEEKEEELQAKILKIMMTIPNIIDPSFRSERTIPRMWKCSAMEIPWCRILKFPTIPILWRALTA